MDTTTDDVAEIPIIQIQPVELQFTSGIGGGFVAAQVQNNVLVVASAPAAGSGGSGTNRLVRIDLDVPGDVDDIDLPKRPAETGIIQSLFLDPSASHLIITTTLNDNYYLHTQSRQPRPLSRLKGVAIESVAWNPSLPTASTREILIGTGDGSVYEDYIEPSSEFYRSQEKYLKLVYKASEAPICGIHVGTIPGRPEVRRCMLATPNRILHFMGRVGRHGSEGSGSIYSKLFEAEAPTMHEVANPVSTKTKYTPSALVISPDSAEDGDQDGRSAAKSDDEQERWYAWLNTHGVMHGKLRTTTGSGNLGSAVFNNSKSVSRQQILPAPAVAGKNARGKSAGNDVPLDAVVLSQWHLLCLTQGRVVALRRLDDERVYDEIVVEAGEKAVCLVADQKKNTYWLFTTHEIFEIVLTDEDRDVWKIMLKNEQFGLASQYANTPAQKDAVAMASGDHLVSKGRFLEAADVYGKSSRPFEQVVLTFIDHGEQDALRKYLLTKLGTYKKSSIMQRTLIASWLVEIFMAKLDSLDDTIVTKAQLVESANTAETKDELGIIRQQFEDFVAKYKTDLDVPTVYEVIGSHGREQELLSYATAIEDSNYVLSYWVQRDKWQESLNVLKKLTDPDCFYKYSSVLMANKPAEFVDIVTRHDDLDPVKLIPALLNYNDKFASLPLAQNQAVRYLNYCINTQNSTSPAIHNTLLSVYASHPSPNESALLAYLSTHSAESSDRPPPYDADFAFRLCIQHKRVHSAVHIYSSMGEYSAAVALALRHNEVELASLVADQSPDADPALRKRLWLEIAKTVIENGNADGSNSDISTTLSLLQRTPSLRIEDLLPLLPPLLKIDTLKEPICTALETYSRSIAHLDTLMDTSATTSQNIKRDISRLKSRYALVTPGESCPLCTLPLLTRQFFVFPSCQHAFHSDCLGKKVLEASSASVQRRIRDAQASLARSGSGGSSAASAKAARELDRLVGGECVLCGDLAIRGIEEGFLTAEEKRVGNTGGDWAI